VAEDVVRYPGLINGRVFVGLEVDEGFFGHTFVCGSLCRDVRQSFTKDQTHALLLTMAIVERVLVR